MKTKLYISIVFAAILTNIAAFAQSTFSSDRLEAALISYLKSETGDDIEVEILQKIKTAAFEDSGVSASFSHTFNDFKGLGNVVVHFKKNNSAIRNESIKVKLRKYKTLPVSIKTISSGKVIESSDVSWKRIDISNYNENEIFTNTDIIGKKAKNGIIKGNPFMFKDVENERMVKRGQNIEIIAESGAVQIRTLGTALQDGAVGDIIRVKREGYGNTVMSGEVSQSGAVILKSYRNR